MIIPSARATAGARVTERTAQASRRLTKGSSIPRADTAAGRFLGGDSRDSRKTRGTHGLRGSEAAGGVRQASGRVRQAAGRVRQAAWASGPLARGVRQAAWASGPLARGVRQAAWA